MSFPSFSQRPPKRPSLVLAGNPGGDTSPWKASAAQGSPVAAAAVAALAVDGDFARVLGEVVRDSVAQRQRAVAVRHLQECEQLRTEIRSLRSAVAHEVSARNHTSLLQPAFDLPGGSGAGSNGGSGSSLKTSTDEPSQPLPRPVVDADLPWPEPQQALDDFAAAKRSTEEVAASAGASSKSTAAMATVAARRRALDLGQSEDFTAGGRTSSSRSVLTEGGAPDKADHHHPPFLEQASRTSRMTPDHPDFSKSSHTRLTNRSTRSSRLSNSLLLHEVWSSPSPEEDLAGGGTRTWSAEDSSWISLDRLVASRLAQRTLFFADRENSDLRKTSRTWFGRHVIHPSSGLKVVWDLLAICLILYDTVNVPLQFFEVPEVLFTDIVIKASLTYWTLDIGMSFCVGYYHRGMLEMRPAKIAQHFCMTWLLFDICVVTLDWVVEVFWVNDGDRETVGRTLKTSAKIVRSCRLLRLVKLHRFIHELQSSINSESLHVFVRVAKLVVIIALVNHVIACAWYGIGRSTEDGWVESGSLPGFAERSIGYKYTTSLHWSLTQFTPASMEVFPTNTGERTFAVMTLLFALVIFSSFVSSITSAMSSLRKLGSGKRKQFIALRWFLRDNAVPKMLSVRIVKQLQHTVTRTMYAPLPQDVELLELLSQPLVMELMEVIVAPRLCCHPFFRSFLKSGNWVTQQICHNAATQQTSTSGDVLAHPGEVAEAMHFVVRGSLGYTHMQHLREDFQEDLFLRLRERTWVCEMTLWLARWLYRGEIVATGACETVALDATKFREITAAHPRLLAYASRYAQKYLAKLMDTEGLLSDVMTFDFSSVDFPTAENQPVLARRHSFVKVVNRAARLVF